MKSLLLHDNIDNTFITNLLIAKYKMASPTSE